MTMKVTVTNDDTARTATITEEDYEIGKSLPVRSEKRTLGPGYSASVYIHASKRVIVSEEP